MNDRFAIERLLIEGFGRFGATEVLLSPALNVISGANEAGKSTLAAFVKGVFYGFGKRGAPSRYQPPHGAHGGEVELSRGERRLIVRRVARPKSLDGELTVMGPHREPLAPRALADALGQVSETLFSQVFSFSVDQLRAFSALAVESTVAEHLFSVGTQGAQRLPQALESLTERADAAFGPKAKTRPLNAKVEQLLAVRQRLSELDASPEVFLATRALVARLETEVDAVRIALDEASARRDRLLVLARARPHRERLQHLSVPLVPPEWKAAPAALRKARSFEAALPQARSAVNREQQAADDAAGLRAQIEVPDIQLVVDSLEQVKTLAAVGRLSGPGVAELSAAKQALLADLALVWPSVPVDDQLGRLEGLDVSLQVLASVDSASLALADARRACEALAVEEAEAQQTVSLAAAQVQSAAAALRAQLTPEGQNSGLEVISSVELAPLAAAWQAVTIATLESQRAQAIAQQRQAEMEALAGPPQRLPWATLALAVVWLVFAAGLAVALPAQAVLWVAAVGMLGGLIAVGRWAQQVVSALRARALQCARFDRAQAASHLAAISASATQAEVVRLLAVGRLREADDAPGALAQAAAFQVVTDRYEVALRLAHASGRRLAEATVTAHRCAEVLEERVVPLGLGAADSLEGVHALADLHRRWRSLRTQMAAAERAEAARVAATTQLAAALEGAKAQVAPSIDETQAWLHRIRGQQTEAHRLEAVGAAHAAAAARWADEVTAIEANLQACWAEGGAADGASLVAAAQAVTQAEAARAEADAAVLALEAAFGGELAGGLAAYDAVGDVAAAVSQVDGDLELLRPHAEMLHAHLGASRQRLERLRHDEERAALRAEESVLVAHIDRLAEQTAIALGARALLRSLRTQAEVEQQPKLVRRASAHFLQLTQGLYRHVSIEPGGKAVKVHEASGTAWPVEALSRGTRELLLFSFHIAMAEELAGSRVALPLLLDDVFVNLDTQRLNRVVDLLTSMSTRHQVVVLTCHDTFAGLLVDRGGRKVHLAPPRQLSLLPSF